MSINTFVQDQLHKVIFPVKYNKKNARKQPRSELKFDSLFGLPTQN